MAARLVVVDEDPVTLKMIRFLLEEEGFEVVTCLRGREVHNAVFTSLTDLIILDVSLPDIDGFTLALDLQGSGYDRPLMFVSGRGSIEDKIRGFDVGADDYLVKPFDPLELVARVRAVLRRFTANESASLDLVIRVKDAALSVGTLTYQSASVEPVLLTPTEMQMLEILMRNQRIVISRERLVERVWGYDMLGDTNRVDVYIRRIRNKIETNPVTPRYLHTVRGVGYVFRPPESVSPNSDIDGNNHDHEESTADNPEPLPVSL